MSEMRLNDLEARVTTLEIGRREDMSAVNLMIALERGNSERITRIEGDVAHLKTDVAELKADMRGVKADIVGLRRDLPGMMVEAVREALKKPYWLPAIKRCDCASHDWEEIAEPAQRLVSRRGNGSVLVKRKA